VSKIRLFRASLPILYFCKDKVAPSHFGVAPYGIAMPRHHVVPMKDELWDLNIQVYTNTALINAVPGLKTSAG